MSFVTKKSGKFLFIKQILFLVDKSFLKAMYYPKKSELKQKVFKEQTITLLLSCTLYSDKGVNHINKIKCIGGKLYENK